MLPRKSIDTKFWPIHGFFCLRGCYAPLPEVNRWLTFVVRVSRLIDLPQTLLPVLEGLISCERNQCRLGLYKKSGWLKLGAGESQTPWAVSINKKTSRHQFPNRQIKNSVKSVFFGGKAWNDTGQGNLPFVCDVLLGVFSSLLVFELMVILKP